MHLKIDVLELGEIPTYELGAERSHHWFGARIGYDNQGGWEAQGPIANRRLLISQGIDEPLTMLVHQLSDRLRELPQPLDGTLIFSIRSASTFDGVMDWGNEVGFNLVPDRHGVLVLGGMAFVEGVHVGVDLEGRDPTNLIEQTCLLLAGKEYDREIPGFDHLCIRVEEDRRLREEKRALVQARARAILLQHLDETQQVEFEATGAFHVMGADGFTYLITEVHQHNVFRIEGGRRTVEYCIVTKDFVPIQDQMLAQMLLLMANPALFHEVTNAWNLDEDGKRILNHRSIGPNPLNLLQGGVTEGPSIEST